MKNKNVGNGDWSEERIKQKILETIDQEKILNKELSKAENAVKANLNKKVHIGIKISKNMKYRNMLMGYLK